MMQTRYMLRCFGTTIILVVILAVDGLLFSSASAKILAADCLLMTGRVYAPNASPHGVPYRGVLDIRTGALTPIENSIRLERYIEGTSPDGRYTAYYERYLTATTASEVVNIVDNRNGTSLPLQPQGGAVHWSPDSRWLAYITRRQDNLTRYALVIANADGRAAHIVDLKDVDRIR